MPECKMFKHGMTIGPNGSVRPCCMYSNYDIDKRYNDDGWREQFDELYEKSKTQWLDNCRECKLEEKRGGTSLRMEANEKFADTVGLKYWDLKLHNTCNLTCVMCNPTSSSKWQTLVLDNPDENWDRKIVKEAQAKHGWHKDILPEMLHNLYDATDVKFTGGEPLLIPHVKKIIKWMADEDIAPNVRLSIITNGTVALTDELVECFAKFKLVVFNISCDGMGKRFEYIREGANWDEFEANVKSFIQLNKRMDHFIPGINYLPMSVNAAQEHELEQWCKNLNIHYSKSVELFRPNYLTYSSLSNKLRERYNVQSDYEYDPEMHNLLLEKMAIKDRLLGTDFKSVCPEFFE